MALFRRRSPRGGEPELSDRPDEVFAFLTVTQANRLRDLTRQALAEAGSEVIVYADHMLAADGTRYGLSNLAASCHNAPGGEAQWPQLVRRHVRVLGSVSPDDSFTSLTREQVAARTFARVMPTADVRPATSYGREIASGLTEVLNLDQPETVAYFTDDDVATFGPLEDLRRAGYANLLTVPVTGERVEHAGGNLEILTGDSVFVASLLLVLGDVLERRETIFNAGYGVFVTVPARDVLGMHVLHDRSAIDSLNLLAGMGGSVYDTGVGPVSPDVYWWRPGRLECVSHLQGGAINIDVGDELAAVLNAVVGSG